LQNDTVCYTTHRYAAVDGPYPLVRAAPRKIDALRFFLNYGEIGCGFNTQERSIFTQIIAGEML
jgi:hypothetical protein